MSKLCHNYGDPDAPGCLRDADARFTMDFTDVEPGPAGYIHWCSKCGPIEHALSESLTVALDADPDFASRFEASVTAAEAELKAGAH